MWLFRVLSLYILVIVSLSLFYSHALFRNVPGRKKFTFVRDGLIGNGVYYCILANPGLSR